MSTTVWFEQVDRGLLEELEKTLLIKSPDGNYMPLPEPKKAFKVRKPEEDFQFEIFPCATIYCKEYQYQYIRHTVFPDIKNRIPEKHMLTFEENALPYDLDYQIDFWSRYKEDMDTMLLMWVQGHYRQFNLPVIDSGGHKRTVNCIQRGNIMKSDLISEGERLFHSFLSLTIWVEIDENRSYNKPMVTTVHIDASQEKRGENQ